MPIGEPPVVVEDSPGLIDGLNENRLAERGGAASRNVKTTARLEVPRVPFSVGRDIACGFDKLIGPVVGNCMPPPRILSPRRTGSSRNFRLFIIVTSRVMHANEARRRISAWRAGSVLEFQVFQELLIYSVG